MRLLNIAEFVAALILSYFLAFYMGGIYSYFFPQAGGLFTIPEKTGYFIIGLPLSYIFFLTFFFTTFGWKQKYWWVGILLIPAVAFEVYFDLPHIYFPIVLGLAGWLLGFLISKFLPKAA